MLTAIIFIVIIGTITALTLSLLSTNVAKTTNTYLYEQAKLLARSATEYAVMAVTAHNIQATNNCINNIDFSYKNIFDINITIYYLGKNLPAGCNLLANDLASDKSSPTIMVDTKVSLSQALKRQNPNITYFRRTLQKL